MERNLVLPAQPPYQETEACEAEKPQPYLEAKLYIERIEQENKICQEENGTDRTHEPLEGPEPVEHGVSLMMYPIRVPSMHLTCATVQWDMQHTSTDDTSSDAASVDKLICSDGAGLDLTVNPLSSDTPSLSQEGFIDLIPEYETEQTHSNAELQQEPAATVDNFCQIDDGEGIDDHVCETPSNEKGQGPCEDTSQTSEASGENGSVKSENSTDRIEDTVCIEELEIQLDLQSSETLEEDEDFLTEQALGNACKKKEGLGLYSGDGNERGSVNKNGTSLVVIAHDEEDQKTTYQSNTSGQQEQEQEDAGDNVEPDLMEESDQTPLPSIADPPEPAEKPPDCLFDASQTEDATDSDKMEPKQEPDISQTEQPEATGNSEDSQQGVLVATLNIISDDEELKQLEQLQHAETFQKMQESAWVDKQGEPTRDEQSESSVETEFSEHGECSARLEPSEEPECLDKLEHSEESKEQESSVDEEPSEESENCSAKTELLEQSEGSKESQSSEESKEQESSVDEVPSEGSEKVQCSAKTELLEHSEGFKETQPSEESKEWESSVDEEPSEESEKFQCSTKTELLEQSEGSKETQPPEQSKQSECSSEAETSEQSKQTGCCSENEPSPLSNQENSQQTNQLDQLKQTETQQHIENEQLNEDKEQSEHVVDQTEQSLAEHMHGASVQKSVIPMVPHENGIMEVVDREEARRLAERLYKLENVQRTDVVRHLDKDTEFSRAVGEEYLKFYDFTDQTLDEALRSFLKEVVLIGETQERERVLDRFSSRYQQCNPNSFSSPGPVLTLTCALMLLNTDLHGQNVGKAMSFTDFMSNMDGMNEGDNFSKDLLKTLYNSIKNHPLEWAVEEKELVKSMILEKDSDQDASLRSKSNPFQDLAHDKKATVFQKGFLKRKAHADIDGKRTPWGKRSWKTFYAVLKGMVLYLQKDEYRKDWQSSEEVLSVHHSLAERAEDYTKRPHVFRLQTADWRVFLFEAASTEQMNSWIGRINLVSALYSSPPFPAAVGSQRKFCRPILPATQSPLTLEKQLQSHARMLQSFQEDLSALQQGVPEGRKAKARELEEHRLREEYLQHERCRYEAYIQILEVWQMLGKSSEAAAGTDLTLFDQELWKGVPVEEEDSEEIDGGMKRSHSSPSLELELAPPPVVKVRRNISERRTYRKIVVPRRNKEL